LTEQSLNAFIRQTVRGRPDTRNALATEAKRDLKAFLQRHFTVTAAQQRRLDAYSAADRESVNSAIDRATTRNELIAVRFINATTHTNAASSSGGSGAVTKAGAGKQTRARAVSEDRQMQVNVSIGRITLEDGTKVDGVNVGATC
jgi:hypothetical protein